jgi:beta-phosphoglucomutase-like phosphatase (HAD superfamily)
VTSAVESAPRAPQGAPFGAVLLDLDGCLIDSNDAHARAWSAALARFGRSVPAARLRGEIGKGGAEIVRDLVTPAERHFLGPAIGNLETELFLKAFSRVRPVPRAAAAVRAMRRAGVAVVLASSADREVVKRAIARLRLESSLLGFTCAADVEKAKPFHDVFALAISRFRLGARRPVAVGDTPYDIAAAHQIGVPCLALRSGGFPERTLSRADAVFDDLSDLWSTGRELFAA